MENIRSLCETILEPLRQHAGIPIQLNSGYRCPALNRAVGGSSQSHPLKGEAADIRVPDPQTGEAWFRWMRDHLPFDQLIKERSSRTSPSFWIHVSHRRRGSNRRQVIGDLIKSI
ncbi:MAG: D-Ala-D-Ala carboxypeptidase family metallohydrolase [Parabacteroides sp.]|nr:D-Ala-D-Ala carboxypeptidase family metallohydrolase [Parabacteroides sp.]